MLFTTKAKLGKVARTIRVSHTSFGVGDVDATDDELVALFQAMKVKAMPHTEWQHRRLSCSSTRDRGGPAFEKATMRMGQVVLLVQNAKNATKKAAVRLAQGGS